MFPIAKNPNRTIEIYCNKCGEKISCKIKETSIKYNCVSQKSVRIIRCPNCGNEKEIF